MGLQYPFIYYGFATLIHLIICANTQWLPLERINKIGLTFVLVAINFLLYPFIAQFATPLILITEIFFVIWRRPHKRINIIGFSLGYLASVCMNYGISVCTELIFDLSISETQNNHMLSYGVVSLVSTYLITKLISYLLYEKLKIQKLQMSNNLILCFVGNLSIIVILFVINIIYGETLKYDSKVLLFNALLFTIYFALSNLLFFYIYKTLQRDELLKTRTQHFDALKEYTEKIEEANRNMRKFKHDYTNIFLSMKDYIDNEDIKNLHSYFYDKIFPLHQTFIDSDTQLGRLGNLSSSELKSLISSKIICAMEMGISVNLEIADPIEQISMDIIDLISILGIFLDNALEASNDSKEKILHLALINENSSITIILKNSTCDLKIPLEKLTSLDSTSKGASRGIGLYNVDKILSAHPNVLWQMDYVAPYFIQKITIINIKKEPI